MLVRMLLLTIMISIMAILQIWLEQRVENNCYMLIRTKETFDDVHSNNSLSHIYKYVANRTQGPPRHIPYYVFHTYETDYVPWKLKFAINSLIEKNPEYSYRYFNNTERRELLQRFYGKIVVDCYDKLIPKAFKADLFRYALIYLYGGCYTDIPYVFTDSISSVITQNLKFFSTVDEIPEIYSINSAFFCASPGHQMIRIHLQKALKSISEQNYQQNPLNITGPRKHAAAYKQYFNVTQIVVGSLNNQVLLLYRKHIDFCLIYQYQKPNSDIIALNRYPDFNTDRARQVTSQHYSLLYQQHRVFNQSIKVQLPWNYTFPKYQQINDPSKQTYLHSKLLQQP